MVEKHKRRKEGFIWGGLGCPRLHYYNFRGPEQPTSKKKYDALSFLSKGRDRKRRGRNHEPLTNHEQEPGHGEEVSDSERITALP